MKNAIAAVLFPILVLALGVCGGCSSSEGFDAEDIAIVGHSAVLQGTTLIWSMTLANSSDQTADLDLQVRLSVVGSATPFYSSPVHEERLGDGETRTFSYADTGVAVPPGTSAYEATFTFTALPD